MRYGFDHLAHVTWSRAQPLDRCISLKKAKNYSIDITHKKPKTNNFFLLQTQRLASVLRVWTAL